MKRVLMLALLAVFSAGMLSACNTVAGAGKDMQKAGEKVEDKAHDCSDGKCSPPPRPAAGRAIQEPSRR